MARISVAKEILHQAKVGTLVGEVIAACMPKHVRVDTAEGLRGDQSQAVDS